VKREKNRKQDSPDVCEISLKGLPDVYGR